MLPPTTATLTTLPNGLSVILDPDDAAPVVSAQLWIETGSIHEDQLLGSGLSHFLEHMVFKGAGEFGPTELAETVQAAGGHWNAYTSFDRTVYYIDGPDSGLDDFLRVLAAMVFEPHLPESEFEREKDVIRREIDMGLDDPDDRAHQLLFSTAFVHDARRQPVIGHRHLFDAIQYDDLRSYHASRYSPDRACLCLSGNFDEAALQSRITEIFGRFDRGGGKEPVVPVDSEQLGPRHGSDTFAIPASKITLVWKTPPLGHPDTPALDLAAVMLGKGRSAPLYRHLRQERELALQISAWSWNGPGREGLFGITAEADPAKRDALIEAIRSELVAYTGTSLEDDLARAKRQVAAAQFRALSTASGRATDLASNWHEARDLDFTRRYVDQLEAVNAAAIREALAKLTESRETLTVLDPEDAPVPTAMRPARKSHPEPETFTLANGTTVALLPDPRVPVIAVQAAIRAGAASETTATAGLNRLLAATLPQATRHHDAAELSTLLESRGASVGASSGNNSLLVQLAGLTPDLDTLLPLFGEILAAPALDSAAIDRERAAQLAQLRETLADPLSVAFRQLRGHLFGDTGFGVHSLGEEASLEALDRLALAAHHSLHFRGPNLVVALAGDFDPTAARELLAKALDPLPGGEAWQPPSSTVLEAAEHVGHLPKKQAVLALGYPGAAALDNSRHALRFLQEWCTDMAGPLFMRIREQLGLAYQVGATQFHGHDTGLFAFYMATDPGQVELAEEELRSQIAALASDGIPADAFDRVRATVLSATAIEMQSPGSVARHAAIDLLFGLPVTHHRDCTEIYRALTPDAVRSTARDLLDRHPTLIRILPEVAQG
ncbi:M16 family metallopeptidase [Haloferula sp. A504]|uniref:M16 family metallopeptidase n=1 Tax=Haloferula sp. A504 TaxID=3373601 RepID=UPI0031C32291|nr:insulinase family protein [Verrucomicrobiaceae bacterium E54]